MRSLSRLASVSLRCSCRGLAPPRTRASPGPLKGRAPITVRAGEGLLEPPNVDMTGYNRSTIERTRVVIFYVADPGAPSLDLMH